MLSTVLIVAALICLLVASLAGLIGISSKIHLGWLGLFLALLSTMV